MDAQLLETLYRKYYSAAYAYCLTLCGSEQTAQDLVSDAFVKAWLSLPEDIPSFRYWLLRVCKNLWIDQLQQGTGFLPTGEDSDYYQQVLNYFQENGIKTYGCYIITTPQTLLQMLEEGSACYISITDAWIGF